MLKNDDNEIKFGRLLFATYVPKTYMKYEPSQRNPTNTWVKADCNNFQIYTFYDKYSRIESVNDQPSRIETWCEDNTCVYSVEWTKNYSLHRIGGPAKIFFDKEMMFCIEGESYSEKEYWNNPLVIQHKLNRILEEREMSL